MPSTNALVALLPAAGSATRFGGGKQLAKLNVKTLLAHAIDNCGAGGCQRIYVISGYGQEGVAKEARRQGAIVFHHTNWAKGMGRSIDFGLGKLLEIPDWDRLLILPADMPWFTGVWIKAMANKVAKLAEEPMQVVATDYPEGAGVPAILSRAFVEHCYFVSPNRNLRKTISAFPGLKTLPSGSHTKDVDYREDLT